MIRHFLAILLFFFRLIHFKDALYFVVDTYFIVDHYIYAVYITFIYWSNVTTMHFPACLSHAEFAKIKIDKARMSLLSFYLILLSCTHARCFILFDCTIAFDIVMKDLYGFLFFYRMETGIIRINIKWNPWKRKKGQCSSDIR